MKSSVYQKKIGIFVMPNLLAHSLAALAALFFHGAHLHPISSLCSCFLSKTVFGWSENRKDGKHREENKVENTKQYFPPFGK